MIHVLFFASIREQLQTGKLSIELDADGITVAGSASIGLSVSTVEQLIAYLASTYDQSWLPVLSADNVIKAVNQQVVDKNFIISDGDEVAFFPPVTGG